MEYIQINVNHSEDLYKLHLLYDPAVYVEMKLVCMPIQRSV